MATHKAEYVEFLWKQHDELDDAARALHRKVLDCRLSVQERGLLQRSERSIKADLEEVGGRLYGLGEI